MADAHPKFDVSVVTPDGAVYQGEAEMLIVPGQAGEIGVLARHAPLVATLKAGSTRVHLGGTEILEFATGPGFFKVETDKALALVDDAVNVKEIDDARATAQLEAAKAELDEARRRDGIRRPLAARAAHPSRRESARSVGPHDRLTSVAALPLDAGFGLYPACTLTLDLVEERGDSVERTSWRLATRLDARERRLPL